MVCTSRPKHNKDEVRKHMDTWPKRLTSSPRRGGKEEVGLTPKKRLRDRQRGAKRLVELRPITTCSTHI